MNETVSRLVEALTAPEPATPQEIASFLSDVPLDLKRFDAAMRDYQSHVNRVNREGARGVEIVAERLAKEFPEVSPKYLKDHSRSSPFMWDLASQLNQVEQGKMADAMKPHEAALNELFEKVADALDSKADAQIEAESKAHKLAESARESAERAAWEQPHKKRQRFHKGDETAFKFAPLVFRPSGLSARLQAAAATVRATKYKGAWGARPSEHCRGMLSQALLSHSGTTGKEK